MSEGGGRVSVWEYLGQLRSWQLLVLAAVLFVVDVVFPDPVPILDEVLLGVLTLFLAKWKKSGRE